MNVPAESGSPQARLGSLNTLRSQSPNAGQPINQAPALHSPLQARPQRSSPKQSTNIKNTLLIIFLTFLNKSSEVFFISIEKLQILIHSVSQNKPYLTNSKFQERTLTVFKIISRKEAALFIINCNSSITYSLCLT